MNFPGYLITVYRRSVKEGAFGEDSSVLTLSRIWASVIVYDKNFCYMLMWCWHSRSLTGMRQWHGRGSTYQNLTQSFTVRCFLIPVSFYCLDNEVDLKSDYPKMAPYIYSLLINTRSAFLVYYRSWKFSLESARSRDLYWFGQ